jgi:cell division inhibitor SepF
MGIFNRLNKSNETKETSPSQLIRFTPKTFRESKLIAAELKKDNVVIIDVSELPKLEAIRLIDFLSGILYITEGKYKKIVSKTYLLAPRENLLNKFDDELELY